MRILFKIVLLIFFTLLVSIIYFSSIGLETKRFNKKISQKIKGIDENLNVELNQIKIILDPIKFRINAKTVGPKIIFNKKIVELENIKTKISLKSLIKKEFSIKDLEISTKSLELNNLISIIRNFKNTSQLYLLEKIIKKGYLIADINLEFDEEGKVKENFKINGFLKDGRIELTDNYQFDKIDSVFEYKDKNLEILNLELFFNNFRLNSKKINIKNINNELIVKGKIKNQEIDLNKKNIIYFQNIFPKNFIFKKLKFSSENEFSFKIKDRFKVKNLKILSNIKLKELSFKNFGELKYFFPNVKKNISLLNNDIKIKFENKKYSVRGNGDILIQTQKDKVEYSFYEANDKIKFNTILKNRKNPFEIGFLNFEKKDNSKMQVRIDGFKKLNKDIVVNLISLKEQKNEIKIKNLRLRKNKIFDVEEINLDYLDRDDFKNSIIFSKKTDKEYTLNSSSFNANNLIDNLLMNDNENRPKLIDKNFIIKTQIDTVFIDKKDYIKNFSGNLTYKNFRVNGANLNGILIDNKKFKFTINSTETSKVTTLFIENAVPIINRYKFIKGFEEGILDFNSVDENDKTRSILKIYDFKLKELPTLTKILTLASLQGIADILSGEGIRFNEFEMKFNSKKNLIMIDEIYAIGPAISILMDGYVEKNKLISLRGTLVPATTINKAIGSIPVLGKILVGTKTGEGVFGVSFKIKGPPKKLETTVNPIKTLAPRFITRTLEKIKKK